jgi:hypothetical protein
MTNQIETLTKLVDQNTSSCRIVSVLYKKKGNGGKGKSKGDGEISRQTVLLNVNRDNSLKRDLSVLKGILPTLVNPVEVQACQELITSIQNSLNGFNPEYTKTGYYEGHGNGNVNVSVKDEVYVRGYVIKKEVLVPGVYDPVKSNPKTLAKNKLRKQLKNTRCREFLVSSENLKSLSVNGNRIFLDLVGPFDLPVKVNEPESVVVAVGS